MSAASEASISREAESQDPSQMAVSRGRVIRARVAANRLGSAGAAWIVVLAFIALFADFVAPYGVDEGHSELRKAPPHRIHLFREGSLVPLRPFVYEYESTFNAETFALTYSEDRTTIYPVRFFVTGTPYQLFGLMPMRTHFFGVDEGGTISLLGTDALGRDVLSRTLIAARVSLTVPLVGMMVSVALGSLLGVASGYWGGWPDSLLQRLAEMLMAFPQIPLWMALATALPADLPPYRRYLGVTLVLSLIGWASLCRQVRGKTLALREADFIMAARASGSSTWTILLGHLVPNCFSHIVVNATLSLPGLILAESALSFLGIGITPPLVSWGTLLKDAQNVQALISQPWLLSPGLFIVSTVLAFNVFGDALRDAFDPYSKVR